MPVIGRSSGGTTLMTMAALGMSQAVTRNTD
jgi:hypothetical protein